MDRSAYMIMEPAECMPTNSERPAGLLLKPTMGMRGARKNSKKATKADLKPNRAMLPKHRTKARLKPISPVSDAPLTADRCVHEIRKEDVGSGDDVAQVRHEHHLQDSRIIAFLIQANRMHNRWVRAQVALILQGKAICRWATDGDKTKASAIFDAAMKGKPVPSNLQIPLLPFLEAIPPFEVRRKMVEKQMITTVKQLPIYEWAQGIHGFGDLSLAKVIGETGDLSNYDNPSRVWKRMGLAVIRGERQRKHSSAELAELHGYNPSRRALMYVISECLLKANKGEYRQTYDERKAYTTTRAENPIGRPAHAHKEAMRYMTKRLLRNMWAQWRKTIKRVEPDPTMSSAN